MRNRYIIPTLAAILVALGCGGSGDAGAVSHGAWQKVTQGVDPNLPLSDVFVAGKNDVWISSQTGTLLHKTGTGFHTVTPVAQSSGITRLWGLGPDAIWAVAGESVLKWDGAAWTSESLANQGMRDLAGVHGCSATDVWVIDGTQGFAANWNGSAWTRYLTNQNNLESLWCSAHDDVWVSGPFGLAHFTGTTFQTVDTGSLEFRGGGFWGSSPHDLWGVGDAIGHWNGKAWSDVSSDIGPGLSDAHGLSSKNIWAVGGIGSMAHWDGSRWTRTQFDYQLFFNGVHGASDEGFWAVGVNSNIWHHPP
jgi:hypothetical protein